ncbi:MAG: hypothetical protein II825_10740 [Paludibacteraceae bacterium]|nr:hypothetical protein [Paludibacteraceae bacterium]
MANTFNKLVGMVSTYRKVETFLREELSINLYYSDTEEKVESRISAQLEKAFGKENVDNQHYVGGNNGLKCDIDLYNGKCGIELKLADQLDNANNLQRALGQVIYYSHCTYKENDLILLVVGAAAELSPKLKELKEIIDDFESIHFIYKQAQNKKK